MKDTTDIHHSHIIHSVYTSLRSSIRIRFFFLICFLIFSQGLWGCSRLHVTTDLPAASQFRSHYNKLVLIPVSSEDQEFADCLEQELQEDLDYLEFIDGDTFQDILFPWFETYNRPTETSELLSFVTKPLVREKISSLGIELLIYVEGRTRWDQINGSGGCFAGPGAAGCFGYVSSDKETVMSTTVVDLKESEFLGGSQIISKGFLAVPMLILPIPIPIGLYTETSACEKTALNIANRLMSR